MKTDNALLITWRCMRVVKIKASLWWNSECSHSDCRNSSCPFHFPLTIQKSCCMKNYAVVTHPGREWEKMQNACQERQQWYWKHLLKTYSHRSPQFSSDNETDRKVINIVFYFPWLPAYSILKLGALPQLLLVPNCERKATEVQNKTKQKPKVSWSLMQFITTAERRGRKKKKLLLSSSTLPDVYTKLPDVFRAFIASL